MKPAAFRYHRPDTLDEALALLAEHGDAAKPIAGGQSLVPMMNLRLAQPAELVDLAHLPGLDTVVEAGDEIVVGASVRHQVLADHALVRARCPLLAEAASGIGHYAIRQRGTLGGSLAHADPAAQLPLVAVALGAQIELASTRGRRVLGAAEFFLSIMTTALAADELIVGVRFPAARPGEGAAFRLFNRRRGDFAIVAVGATVQLKGGQVERLRLAVGGVEPVPVLLEALAGRQAGRRADAAWVAEVAAAAREAVDAQDDDRIPQVYRRELTEALVARAVAAAIENTGARP
jgi:aerobic carbon-monoxide dehydrogenase medium subunit